MNNHEDHVGRPSPVSFLSQKCCYQFRASVTFFCGWKTSQMRLR